MPRGKASFDTMKPVTTEVIKDTGFHGNKKLETDLYKDKDFTPVQDMDQVKKLNKAPSFDDVVNKMIEVDSSLVVKSFSKTLGTTAIGTGLGATMGAATADPDKRAEGAKRGAVAGGIIGAATPTAHNKLNKYAKTAKTQEGFAASATASQKRETDAARIMRRNADQFTEEANTVGRTTEEGRKKLQYAKEQRDAASQKERWADWNKGNADTFSERAKKNKDTAAKLTGVVGGGTMAVGSGAAGASTRYNKEEKGCKKVKVKDGFSDFPEDLKMKDGYNELPDDLQVKGFDIQNKTFISTLSRINNKIPGMSPLGNSPVLRKVREGQEGIRRMRNEAQSALGNTSGLKPDLQEQLRKEQAERAAKLMSQNASTTPEVNDVMMNRGPGAAKPGIIRRNRGGILKVGGLVGTGAVGTAALTGGAGPNTTELPIKPKGLEEDITIKILGLKPIAESPILQGIKKARTAVRDLKDEAVKITTPDTKPAPKPETWGDIAKNTVDKAKREGKARVGEAKQGKAIYDLGRKTGMSRKEAIDEVKRIRDINPNGPSTPIPDSVKYGAGGLATGAIVVGESKRKEKGLGHLDYLVNHPLPDSVKKLKPVALGLGTGLVGGDLANRLQDRRVKKREADKLLNQQNKEVENV